MESIELSNFFSIRYLELKLDRKLIFHEYYKKNRSNLIVCQRYILFLKGSTKSIIFNVLVKAKLKYGCVFRYNNIKEVPKYFLRCTYRNLAENVRKSTEIYCLRSSSWRVLIPACQLHCSYFCMGCATGLWRTPFCWVALNFCSEYNKRHPVEIPLI